MEQTPTLKFYVDPYTPVRYLVSVRGTQAFGDYGYGDLQADKQIAFGRLEMSARYQQDVEDMRRVLGDRPQGSKVYCTGHSLGGAICDLFLKQGLADGAVTYNPAMQLNAQEPRNHRVYNEHDPLYLLGIPHFNTPPEVKKDDVTATAYNDYARQSVPYMMYDELRAHGLAGLSGSGKQMAEKMTGGEGPDLLGAFAAIGPGVKKPRGARGSLGGAAVLAGKAAGEYMGLGPQQAQTAITPARPDWNTPFAVANTPEEYARRMQAERDDYEKWLAASMGPLYGRGKKTAEMYKAFTEDDIRSFCGNIPIMRYPELAKMTDPSELFQGKGAAALLFLTDGPSEGHWLAVLDRPDHYEVFDSFGTAIDGHRRWLDKRQLIEFDQAAPLLSNLLKGKGKPVIHNTKKLQSDTADTCGRYVAARIVQAATPLKQFVVELTSNGQTPDENIIEMTEPRDRAHPELANPA
jgi:hypothetical protein